MNDYIEHSRKYIKEYYDANPNLYQETTTPDGNMYSLQSHNPAVHTTMPYKMWINTVWLDNLGLEMPTTTEEFYEVLKAFKEKTGVSLLVNTSFNVRGEPIVCTPKDAYACFMQTDMDILVLEKIVIFKDKQKADQKRWERKFEND